MSATERSATFLYTEVRNFGIALLISGNYIFENVGKHTQDFCPCPCDSSSSRVEQKENPLPNKRPLCYSYQEI